MQVFCLPGCESGRAFLFGWFSGGCVRAKKYFQLFSPTLARYGVRVVLLSNQIHQTSPAGQNANCMILNKATLEKVAVYGDEMHFFAFDANEKAFALVKSEPVKFAPRKMWDFDTSTYVEVPGSEPEIPAGFSSVPDDEAVILLYGPPNEGVIDGLTIWTWQTPSGQKTHYPQVKEEGGGTAAPFAWWYAKQAARFRQPRKDNDAL